MLGLCCVCCCPSQCSSVLVVLVPGGCCPPGDSCWVSHPLWDTLDQRHAARFHLSRAFG